MKAVIQRVTRASVEVDGQPIGNIGAGMLVLLGDAREDSESDVRYMIEKISALRIFSDQAGKMNLSVAEIGGALLVASQFTLLGDTGKGRRPSFDKAAPPDQAQALYARVIDGLKGRGLRTETGVFGAHMNVSLENDGPVTLILDSRASV